MPRNSHNIMGLKVHPKESKYDFSIDMRIHIKANSAEQAIEKADRLAHVITRKVPWAYLVVKRWKGE